MAQEQFDYDYVRRMAEKLCNWGKWGPDDELGTVNYITPEKVIEATRLVQRGKIISLATPFGADGPQRGGFRRFNPIHMMIADAGDMDENGLGHSDDMVSMPLQCATQWDSLAHVFFMGKMYGGHDPRKYVTSNGATRNSITTLKDKLVTRGVLLDIPRYKGKQWLEDGEAIFTDDIVGCAAHQKVEIRRGDIVLIRTGQMAAVKARGSWGEYAGGPAPGLSLTTAEWIATSEIAGYATDTWGTEVIPNETTAMFQPLHRIVIPYVGILMGEIFDLDELAADCAADGVYEFMFTAPPLPITGAVGAAINPIAVK